MGRVVVSNVDSYRWQRTAVAGGGAYLSTEISLDLSMGLSMTKHGNKIPEVIKKQIREQLTEKTNLIMVKRSTAAR